MHSKIVSISRKRCVLVPKEANIRADHHGGKRLESTTLIQRGTVAIQRTIQTDTPETALKHHHLL